MAKHVVIPPTEPEHRRSFFYRVATGAIGLVVGIVPLVSGLVVFLNPLRRGAGGESWIKVASLGTIPADGKPYRFPVIATRRDAWNTFPPEPIGSVYLRRTTEEGPPVAYSSVCPHLGCAVDYSGARTNIFALAIIVRLKPTERGSIPTAAPARRDLDTVDVEVRGDEVWVDYRRFKGGVAEKIEE